MRENYWVGATVGGLSVSLPRSATGAVTGKQETAEVPWPYKKLDPETVAENAYTDYYRGACCYGVFNSIVGQLQKEVGPPYTGIPTSMMVYGEGGIAGVASVCGALNGASAVIYLVTGSLEKEKRELGFSIIEELFNWYEQAALPDYRPKKPQYEIGTSVPRSNLCHVSVSRWCRTAGFKSFSKERSERCGWLTASVAKHTVELLNKNVEGDFKGIHKLSSEIQTCRSCHDKGGRLENTCGMMDCGGCHFTPKTQHPKI